MSLRVLLDECLPKKLKRDVRADVVMTVQEMAWSSTKNGELMRLARGQFDVFMTADQNLQYQQNLAYADIGVIVLIAPSNRIEVLKPLMPQVNQGNRILILEDRAEVVLTPAGLQSFGFDAAFGCCLLAQ